MHILQITFVMSLGFGIIVLREVLPPRGVSQVTVHELKDMLQHQEETSYQYIDVRPTPQFERLHIYGFKNIPLTELKKRYSELSKNNKVVIISHKGLKSMEACKLLKQKGFSDLVNVRGGVISWEPHH